MPAAAPESASALRSAVRAHAAAAAVFVLCATLSLALFLVQQKVERNGVIQAFGDASFNRGAVIKNTLYRSVEAVDSVGALFDASGHVARATFETFAGHQLAVHPGIQALEWIPRVPAGERALMEAAARADIPDFQFTVRETSGRITRAGPSEEYFPVYYVVPLAGNEPAVGFDLASNPARLEAIARSRDSGTATATSRVVLVQERFRQHGVLIFRPVYRRGVPLDTTEQRRANLLGFALGVFRIPDVVESAIATLAPSGIDIEVRDESAPEADRYLYFHGSRRRGAVARDAPDAGAVRDRELVHRDSLVIGGREWRLIMSPAPGAFSLRTSTHAWLMLAIGVALSALLAGFVEINRGRLVKLADLERQRKALAVHFDYLSKYANDMIILFDDDLRIVDVNDRVVTAFQRSREELIGAPRSILRAPGYDNDDPGPVQSLASTGNALYETLACRKDGSTFPTEVSLRRVEIEGKLYYQGIARDITERKRAREALERSERYYRKLIEGSADAFIVVDATGNEKFRSESAERMTGYTAAEMLDKPLIAHVHPDSRPNAQMALANALQMPGEALHLEVRFVRPDGSVIDLEAVGRNLLDDPDVRGIVVIVRDITERKRAEVRLTKLNRLYLTLSGINSTVLRSRDTRELYANVCRVAAECGQFAISWVGVVDSAVRRVTPVASCGLSPGDDVLVVESVGNVGQGRGRTATAVRENRIVFTNDYQAQGTMTRWRAEALRRGILGSATVPVTCEGHAAAVLKLYVSEPGFFDDEQVALLEEMGRSLSFALEKLREEERRARAEQDLFKSNRALKALTACNTALIQSADESELLHRLCDAVAEVSDYAVAWVGLVRKDEQASIEVVAASGRSKGFAEGLDISWADTPRGRGLAGTAVRTGKAQLSPDMRHDTRLGPWHGLAAQFGISSAMVLPLKENGGVFGVVGIDATEPNAFGEDEIRLLGEMADDLAFGIRTLRIRAAHDRMEREALAFAERIKQALTGTIQAMALTVEMRDPYTAGHQQRVSWLATAIAEELGLLRDQVEGVRIGASILDIGIGAIPAEILNRPGTLDRYELELVRLHPQTGHGIVRDIDFPWPVAQMILQHHERLDGSGYPAGLKGEAILHEARILAVADVVEAMCSHRPYRPALGLDAALEEIARHKGRLYDAAVVDACVRLFRDKGFSFTQAPAAPPATSAPSPLPAAA